MSIKLAQRLGLFVLTAAATVLKFILSIYNTFIYTLAVGN